MTSIYQEIILDHYHSPHNFGDLPGATNTSYIENVSCGDKITLKALIKNNKIVDIKFTGVGCAISTASASMLTDFAKGKSVSDLKKMNTSSMLELLGIELSPNRLKCALIPLEALNKLV